MPIRKTLPVLATARRYQRELTRELGLIEFNYLWEGSKSREEIEYELHLTLLLHAGKIKNYLRLYASQTFKERFEL
jgi:hypothetical protein